MAIPPTTVAYGTVVIAGLVLFAIGTPVERSNALQARLAADKPVTPAYSVAVNKQVAVYAAAVGPRAAPAVAEADGIKLRSVGWRRRAHSRQEELDPHARYRRRLLAARSA